MTISRESSGSGRIMDPTLLNQLEEKLSYHFQNREYLIHALTHRSYTFEHKEEGLFDNERLEFVGDSVLGLAIATFLFNEESNYPEGQLSKMRAAIVCERTLAEAARNLGLGECLWLGRGEEKSGGRDKDSNLSNAMEALFAAVFLDAGFDEAAMIVRREMQPFYALALQGELISDYKTSLLELAQSIPELPPLEFIIVGEDGPIHQRVFTAEVHLSGEVLGRGQGKSKKQAEQQAANAALTKLRTDSAR